MDFTPAWDLFLCLLSITVVTVLYIVLHLWKKIVQEKKSDLQLHHNYLSLHANETRTSSTFNLFLYPFRRCGVSQKDLSRWTDAAHLLFNCMHSSPPQSCLWTRGRRNTITLKWCRPFTIMLPIARNEVSWANKRKSGGSNDKHSGPRPKVLYAGMQQPKTSEKTRQEESNRRLHPYVHHK